jgi:hypothetical protein
MLQSGDISATHYYIEDAATISSRNNANNLCTNELPLSFGVFGRSPAAEFPFTASQSFPIAGQSNYTSFNSQPLIQQRENVLTTSGLQENNPCDYTICIGSKDVDTLIPVCNQSDSFNNLSVADVAPGMMLNCASTWQDQPVAASICISAASASSMHEDGFDGIFPASVSSQGLSANSRVHTSNVPLQFSPIGDVCSTMGLVPGLAINSGYGSSQITETVSVPVVTDTIRRSAGSSISK